MNDLALKIKDREKKHFSHVGTTLMKDLAMPKQLEINELLQIAHLLIHLTIML